MPSLNFFASRQHVKYPLIRSWHRSLRTFSQRQTVHSRAFPRPVHSSCQQLTTCKSAICLILILLLTFCINIFTNKSNNASFRRLSTKANSTFAASDNFLCANRGDLPGNGSFILLWAFSVPPSVNLLRRSLQAITRTNPNVVTKVLCASSPCVELVKGLRYPCVLAERLIVPKLMVGTPLEEWAREHVLMKLLSVHLFEEHLQFIAQLAALWRYGGTVLAPGVLPTKSIQHRSWIGIKQDNKQIYHLMRRLSKDGPQQASKKTLPRFTGGSKGFYAISTDAKAPFIKNAMQAVWSIAKQPYSLSSWPISFDWDVIMMNAVQETMCSARNRNIGASTTCVTFESLQQLGVVAVRQDNVSVPNLNRNFGTLTYNARRTYLLTRRNSGMNIGDEMQGLAGIQFLPYVNAFVERDRLDVVRLTKDLDYTNHEHVSLSDIPRNKPPEVTVFLNAWYASSTWVWPPPAEIDPILVSMHFEEGRKERVIRDRSYLAENGLVGARDEDTDHFLSSHGISSIFSGCLTLTLQPLDPERKDSSGEVLIVDVNEKIITDVLPPKLIHGGIRLSHKVLNSSTARDRMERYYHAFKALRRYSRAKLVITQRLHVALPSVAMGVPVVFLNSQMLPGGGRKSAKSRMKGLDRLVHTFDASDPEAKHILSRTFDWTNPPKNPGENFRLALKRKLLTLVMCHENILDSAKMFGMVPPEWKASHRHDVCSAHDLGLRTIHIAVTLDNKWISVLPTWLRAIVKNNEGEKLSFHFLTDSLKPSTECIVAEVVKRVSGGALIFFHKADRLLSAMRYRPGRKHQGKISRVTQARLYLSSFLPCLDRVLYLDMDALVLRNLRELWDSEVLSPCGIMARTSTLPHVVQHMASHLDIPGEQLEFSGFNAGVMLLDLRKLRESEFERTIVSYFGEHMGANDQIVYNLACNGTHDDMPAKWNVFDSTRRKYTNTTTVDEDKWAIVHFAGSVKPFLTQNTPRVSTRSFKLWKEYQTSISEILESEL